MNENFKGNNKENYNKRSISHLHSFVKNKVDFLKTNNSVNRYINSSKEYYIGLQHLLIKIEAELMNSAVYSKNEYYDSKNKFQEQIVYLSNSNKNNNRLKKQIIINEKENNISEIKYSKIYIISRKPAIILVNESNIESQLYNNYIKLVTKKKAIHFINDHSIIDNIFIDIEKQKASDNIKITNETIIPINMNSVEFLESF